MSVTKWLRPGDITGSALHGTSLGLKKNKKNNSVPRSIPYENTYRSSAGRAWHKQNLCCEKEHLAVFSTTKNVPSCHWRQAAVAALSAIQFPSHTESHSTDRTGPQEAYMLPNIAKLKFLNRHINANQDFHNGTYVISGCKFSLPLDLWCHLTSKSAFQSWSQQQVYDFHISVNFV